MKEIKEGKREDKINEEGRREMWKEGRKEKNMERRKEMKEGDKRRRRYMKKEGRKEGRAGFTSSFLTTTKCQIFVLYFMVKKGRGNSPPPSC